MTLLLCVRPCVRARPRVWFADAVEYLRMESSLTRADASRTVVTSPVQHAEVLVYEAMPPSANSVTPCPPSGVTSDGQRRLSYYTPTGKTVGSSTDSVGRTICHTAARQGLVMTVTCGRHGLD